VVAIAVPLALMPVLSRRVRPWVMVALGAFGSLLILGDIVYYRFFGDVPSVPALLGAQQTGRVWDSIRTLLTPGLTWLVIDLPFAVWLATELSGVPQVDGPGRRARLGMAAACMGALAVVGWSLGAPRALASGRFDQNVRNRDGVEQLGAIGYHLYDVWSYIQTTTLRRPATAAEVDAVRTWLADRARLRSARGPSFGAARTRNVIVIQVESLQEFAVDYRVNGQEVMPNLRRWTSDSLRFTNVSDQTSEGRTSDAEFIALTSLLPSDHGAAVFRFPLNHFVGLPRVLAEHGYKTLSAVAFEAGFWNRRVMHPSYGFQQSFFEPDFVAGETIGWGLNDRDFLQQMIPKLRAQPSPFFAWLITLSLHHPFENFPEGRKTLKLGALDGTPFGNYLHTMRFFDQALEEFKTGLGAAGLLDGSVLVVFGDHDAGFSHASELARLIGLAPDESAWEMADRVPLFVRLPGATPTVLRGTRAIPAGQTDFTPTLLALLGIDPAPLPYVGRNLLGEPDDPPLLRPYGDWIDRAHLYINYSWSGRSGACYDVASRARVSERLCGDTNTRARTARDVSRLILLEDLQETFRGIGEASGVGSGRR
jgi:lipoteichoic acid synthase